jgi:DNA-binding transcriptional regulator YiaG
LTREIKDWAAHEILEFRKAHHFTRKALGELLGVTVSALYQWEKEVKRPSTTAKILLSRIEEELTKTEKEVKGHGKHLPKG